VEKTKSCNPEGFNAYVSRNLVSFGWMFNFHDLMKMSWSWSWWKDSVVLDLDLDITILNKSNILWSGNQEGDQHDVWLTERFDVCIGLMNLLL